MTLWDVLADLGGILEILIISTSILVASTQRFYFESSIISKIFLENKYKGECDDRNKILNRIKRNSEMKLNMKLNFDKDTDFLETKEDFQIYEKLTKKL